MSQYHLGAQNDAVFIIKGRMPAPNNDHPNHEADRTAIARVLDQALAQELVDKVNGLHGLRPALSHDLLSALDRMCTPLHPSRLAGATAEADARCMELIRAHILGPQATGPAGDVQPQTPTKVPPAGLLMSMAMRMDSGLGVPGYYDQPFFQMAESLTHRQRLESMLRCMRQVWEEVAGCGFYRPELEASYAARAAQGLGEQAAQEG